MARTRKRASAWTTHVRNVMRACKSAGIPHMRAMKLASATYNKSSGKPKADWKSYLRKHGGKSGGKSGGSRRKATTTRRKGRKGRRGGVSLDSFSGLDSFLSKLLGHAKRVLAPRLRPSETLAQRKANLEKLIDKMGAGISALKDRESIEDMNRAQYNAHVAELKRLQAAQNALKKAWREAHKKTKSGSSEPWAGPGDFGGFMASGDPSRRRKKAKRKAPKRKAPKRRASKSGSARKRTSGRRRVSAATRAKMSRAAKRRWATIRAKKRGGARKSPKRKGAKRGPKRRKKARRDWSGDFGGDSF